MEITTVVQSVLKTQFILFKAMKINHYNAYVHILGHTIPHMYLFQMHYKLHIIMGYDPRYGLPIWLEHMQEP
jgi:hypothetical protein